MPHRCSSGPVRDGHQGQAYAVAPHAGVEQWQAERARKAAQAAGGRTPDRRRYSWPADRPAIIAVTKAAAKDEEGPYVG
jgi:hypothetical protein